MEQGPMKSGRRIVFTFSVILVLTAMVHADMMPVSQEEPVCLQSQKSCAQKELQYSDSSAPLNPICTTNPYGWPAEFLPEVNTNAEQASEIQNLQILTDESGSLQFCLSALISLGLCSSCHWIRKVHLGSIPDWYHDGGPFQIGHSHALMPGTLCPAPVCCFIQPHCAEDSYLPRYFIKTVISTWRKSQFTLEVLASRGPPDMS
jgi:hypothetical protein